MASLAGNKYSRRNLSRSLLESSAAERSSVERSHVLRKLDARGNILLAGLGGASTYKTGGELGETTDQSPLIPRPTSIPCLFVISRPRGSLPHRARAFEAAELRKQTNAATRPTIVGIARDPRNCRKGEEIAFESRGERYRQNVAQRLVIDNDPLDAGLARVTSLRQRNAYFYPSRLTSRPRRNAPRCSAFVARPAKEQSRGGTPFSPLRLLPPFEYRSRGRDDLIKHPCNARIPRVLLLLRSKSIGIRVYRRILILRGPSLFLASPARPPASRAPCSPLPDEETRLRSSNGRTRDPFWPSRPRAAVISAILRASDIFFRAIRCAFGIVVLMKETLLGARRRAPLLGDPLDTQDRIYGRNNAEFRRINLNTYLKYVNHPDKIRTTAAFPPRSTPTRQH